MGEATKGLDSMLGFLGDFEEGNNVQQSEGRKPHDTGKTTSWQGKIAEARIEKTGT